MKKLNIKNLNSNQKIWLADRYLTYQYIDKLKYGDYTELKDELNEDIAEVKEVVEFSEFKSSNYTVAVVDTDENILCYYELDT